MEHTSTFRIRHNECDELKHLYTGSYLRYLHEASVQTSLAAGYDFADLAPDGKRWIPHLSYLDLSHPVRYGESIQIQTRICGSDKQRTLWRYDLRLPEKDLSAATGYILWKYFDTHTNSQITIPLVAQQFGPYNEDDLVPVPEFSPVPAGPVQLSRSVGWRDISPEGTIYAATYLDYMVDAAMQAGVVYQWDFEKIMQAGFVFVAKRIWIEYLQSAKLSEEVQANTWLSNVKRSTALRHIIIERVSDGEALAHGHILFVGVSTQSGRPVRIPENFKKEFGPHIYSG